MVPAAAPVSTQVGFKLDPCRFGGAFDLAWSVLAVHPASSSGDVPRNGEWTDVMGTREQHSFLPGLFALLTSRSCLPFVGCHSELFLSHEFHRSFLNRDGP